MYISQIRDGYNIPEEGNFIPTSKQPTWPENDDCQYEDLGGSIRGVNEPSWFEHHFFHIQLVLN